MCAVSNLSPPRNSNAAAAAAAPLAQSLLHPWNDPQRAMRNGRKEAGFSLLTAVPSSTVRPMGNSAGLRRMAARERASSLAPEGSRDAVQSALWDACAGRPEAQMRAQVASASHAGRSEVRLRAPICLHALTERSMERSTGER